LCRRSPYKYHTSSIYEEDKKIWFIVESRSLKKIHTLDILVFLLALSAVPAAVTGYNRLSNVPGLLALAAGFGLYITISRLSVQIRWWRIFAGGLVGLAAIVAFYFITQSGRLEYANKIDAVFRFSSRLSSFFPAFTVWKPQTNSIGTFLAGIIFLCVPLAAGTTRSIEKWVWGGLAFVIGLGVLLSASHGAWLAVLLAGAVWLALYWRPMRWMLLILAAASFILGGWVLSRGSLDALNEIPVLSPVLNPLFNRPDRFEVIWNSLLLARDFPLTGIGSTGQFGPVYSRYQLFMPFIYHSYSHNMFMQIWLNYGLPGLIIWTSLVTTVLTWLWVYPGASHRIHQEAAWVGLIAILVHGLVEARMTEDIWCWLPFFVLLGLMAGASSMERRDPVPGYLRYAPVYASLAAALVALAPNPVAAISTNLGAVYQAQADLSSNLSETQKEEYLEQAGRHFQRSLAFQPDQVGANYRLGLIAFEQYDFERAIQYFQQARPEGSGHTGLNKALGLAYTFSGRLDDGTPLLKDQIDIIKELNYWGWYFGTIGNQEASQNAYAQADRIECER
jgi:hypothetical protein